MHHRAKKTALARHGFLMLSLWAAAACNQKDATEAAPEVTAQGQAAAPLNTSGPAIPLTTVITNKSSARQQADGSLTLDFAVIGGTVISSLNDFRFQCKREGEADFSLCPNGSIYRFSDLGVGATYEISVQAISISTGAVAEADSFSFTIAASR